MLDASARLADNQLMDAAHIILDPAILSGKPVIAGTRLSVDFVIGLLAEGWTEEQMMENYPGLSRDGILACLAYARDALQGERVFPNAA